MYTNSDWGSSEYKYHCAQVIVRQLSALVLPHCDLSTYWPIANLNFGVSENRSTSKSELGVRPCATVDADSKQPWNLSFSLSVFCDLCCSFLKMELWSIVSRIHTVRVRSSLEG